MLSVVRDFLSFYKLLGDIEVDAGLFPKLHFTYSIACLFQYSYGRAMYFHIVCLCKWQVLIFEYYHSNPEAITQILVSFSR